MTKALYVLAALALSAAPVHAQKSTMVQCQVGVSVRVVPDYMCDAMLEAFPAISFAPGRFEFGVQECARIMSRRVTETRPGDISLICVHMWQNNIAHVVDDAQGRHYR